MKPDYQGWHINDLLRHRRLLHGLLRRGENYPDVLEHLRAIEDEEKQRQFVLLLIWDGVPHWDYGSWRTPEECHEIAKRMGLEVGKEYSLGGKRCVLEVRKT